MIEMIEFRARRQLGERFKSRDGYLKSKTLIAGQQPPFRHGRWLCHAIERVNRELTAGAGPADARAGFPWLTMVLGSGCLSEHDGPIRMALQPSSIHELLKDRDALADGIFPSDLAKSYAQSLLEDRIPGGAELLPGEPGGFGSQPPSSDDHYGAKLVLATALLTSLYHEVEVIKPQALRRWGNDFVTLGAGPQRMRELRTLRVEPLFALLAELKDLGHDAVRRLLEQIGTQLAKERIERWNIQVLTECAWYTLIEGSAEYPGWSDLLVFLSRQQEVFSSQDQGRPRPSFGNPRHVPRLIEARYIETSEQSWQARHLKKPSPRADFYDSVANVLCAQSTLRKATPAAARLPVVSAFVTSFDLELEMALVSTSVPEFIVALPVNVYRGPENEVASICWIGANIKPSEVHSLEDLRRPSNWMMLSNMLWSESSSYLNVPFVVRLTGCPLFQLPAFSKHEGPGALVINPLTFFGSRTAPAVETLELGHAVLLDEFAAMQQHNSDAFFYVPGGEGQSTRYYGLPRQLTGVQNPWHARFWMVAGVQMGDSSVRYSVASRFGARALDALALGLERKRPDRAGLVIASRMDGAARDLLDWYGFDIVEDSCWHYRGDLDHYVRHLHFPDVRTQFDEECRLAGA